MILINTQQKYMKKISDINQIPEILQLFPLETSQTTNYSLEDFHVNLFQLVENEKALLTYEGHVFFKYAKLSKLKELAFYCLRTLKDCSHMIAVRHLQPSSQRLMNWGMTYNGKLLTANILPDKIENESIFLDILEENPDPR